MEEQNNKSPVETNLLDIVLKITGSMLQIYIGHACDDIMQMVSLYFMGKYTNVYQTSTYGVAWLMISLIAFPFCFGNIIVDNQRNNIIIEQSNFCCDGIEQTQIIITLSQFYNMDNNCCVYSYFQLNYLLCQFFVNLFHCFRKPYQGRIKVIFNQIRNIMIPLLSAAFFFMEIECLKLYLMACQIFKPFPYIYGIGLTFHFLLCSILFQAQPNYQSVCIAILSSQVYDVIKKALIFAIIVGYIYFNSEAYSMFKDFQFWCQIFKHKLAYKQYLKVSFYLVFHQYADLIGFYSLSLIGFQLGINETSAQLAFSNTYTVLYKFPLSLQIALMLYIGNSLSQNKIQLAKIFMKSGLGMYSIILTLKMLLLIIFRQQWVNIYTSDLVIKNLMLQALPYLILCFLFDSIQATMSGILKGVNKQETPLHQTIIAYYIIGLPLILMVVVYYHLNLIGIWLGFAVANIYLVAVFIIIIFLLDWKVQVKEIQTRLNLPENQLDEHQYQLLLED